VARMSGRRLAGWAARTVQIRCTDDLGIARIAPRSSIGASAHTRTPAEADSVLAVRVGAGAAGRQLRGQLAPCSPRAIFQFQFFRIPNPCPCLPLVCQKGGIRYYALDPLAASGLPAGALVVGAQRCWQPATATPCHCRDLYISSHSICICWPFVNTTIALNASTLCS
jgi:hypothetical protein